MKLTDSVQMVPGVGPSRVKVLARLGLRQVRDLLFFVPRNYQTYSDILPIERALPGAHSAFAGQIIRVKTGRSPRRGATVDVTLEDDTGQLKLRFFNSLYLLEHLGEGGRMMATGKVSEWQHLAIIYNPEFELLEDSDGDFTRPGSIAPIYELTEGVGQAQIRRIVAAAVDGAAAELPELFPKAFCEKRAMPGLAEAVRLIHNPKRQDDAKAGLRRLKYEEFFVLETALALRAAEIRREPASMTIAIDKRLDGRIRRLFPFEFTGDQNKAIADIAADIARPHPMNRLLQGDVGSGKTAVALYAMLATVAAGGQAALMAPTEVLASQHFRTLSDVLARARVRHRLLVGGAGGNQDAIRREIASGEVDLVVGTHALLGQRVSFARLGLTVVDEQHKFGVLQRSALRQKGGAPHTLVMTATPIPRTLMLSVFGDLETSIIRAMPRGRGRIVTHWVSEARRPEVMARVRREVTDGRRAFIVYPLVEESGKIDVRGAVSEAQRLAENELAGLRVGLLHGRLSTEKKEAAMLDFAEGRLDVLVATTVIEVGIDVPEATLMVVEHADRFGLGTLHQLRGRIGRGAHDAECILIADPSTEDGVQRLKTMVETRDGFRIAEADLRLRGGGEFFGVRQHGLPELRFGDIVNDYELLRLARRDAFAIVKADPTLSQPAHLPVAHRVAAKYKKALELVSVG